MTADPRVEDLLRQLAPQVLGTIVRRFRQFDLAEDAVQEALLAAAIRWEAEGIPESPRGWLVTVAARRMSDQLRSEYARQRREDAVAASLPSEPLGTERQDDDAVPDEDDTLTLLFLCCHPALSAASQIALTLRAVGGLTTAEIARAFLAPESTMAQRISRAKATIKAAGARFSMPPDDERAERLSVVLHVLYLVFNEGYTASAGPDLQRSELTVEAIRLTRDMHRLLPDEGEVAGLLALMLLTDARRPARTRSNGDLVALAEQDRRQWNSAAIAEGVGLITDTLSRAPLGSYQLQAAIAAVHDEAASADETDWREIVVLYQLLEQVGPGPVVTLNRAIAIAMVDGPRAGLAVLAPLDLDDRMAASHRLYAVRAHLLEMNGDRSPAREAYRMAARRSTSLPEKRYLEMRAARLTDDR